MIKKQLLWASTELRSVLRSAGILPYLSRLRSWVNKARGKDAYEQAFDDAMFHELKAGDVIWDIGANVGLYSRRFAEVVGSDGLVVCVEPAGPCFRELQQAVADLDNVICIHAAMGSSPGSLELHVADDPLGVSHTLVGQAHVMDGRKTEKVEVMTGDVLLQQEGVKAPHVIKVDVEGFEEEVLEGLRDVLKGPSFRALFCEIHFAMLEAKGTKHAPAHIAASLEKQGFQVSWPDASHITAKRLA